MNNLKKILSRYNDYSITNNASKPADAELLEKIKFEIKSKKLNSIFININSCYESNIMESLN